jgi:hypothetical protein
MTSDREHAARGDDPHEYRPGTDLALREQLDAIRSRAEE